MGEIRWDRPSATGRFESGVRMRRSSDRDGGARLCTALKVYRRS